MLLTLAASVVCLVPTFQAPAKPPEVRGQPAATAPATTQEAWNGAVTLPGGVELKFLATLIGDKGTIDIPMQGAMGLDLSDVASDGKSVKFVLRPPGASEAAWAHFEAAVADDGNTATGLLKQGGGEFPLKMTRAAAGEKSAELKRPQEPKPPFPYSQRDVTYKA